MFDVHELNRVAQLIGSLPLLNDWFREHVRALGFTTHAVGILREAGGSDFLLLDWPRQWLELYAVRGFGAEDCTIPLALADPAPFTWGDVRARDPTASERVFAAAAEFGWRDGLVVPVHRSDGSRGLIVLAAPALGLSAGARERAVLLSLIAFERASAIHAAPARKGDRLTARQRSALSLVASGLTDDDVASTLGVSRPTAAFHLQTARTRLGAKTRAHAVALALTMGLI